MWLLSGFPRKLPESKYVSQFVEVELARRECNGEGMGELQIIDAHLRYINMVLQICTEDSILEKFSNQIFIGMLNVAYGYEKLAQQLRERAYAEGGSGGEWQASSNYSMKGIGLLQYMEQLQFLPADSVSELRWWIMLYQVSQQLGTIVLTISKMRTRLYPDSKDRFSKMLSFQDSDIELLAKSSVLYARLAIGCSESCGRLQAGSSEMGVSSQIINTKRFLDCLSLMLLSLDKYQMNECGMAIAMIKAAVTSIMPLLTSGQADLVSNYKSLEKFKTKTKLLNHKLKEKFNVNIRKKDTSVHPFILEIISDFLVPLIMVLQARYHHANELFFAQPVENCSWILPQGRSPETKGTKYIFNGTSLIEQTEIRLQF